MIIILITLVLFIFLLFFNYRGSLGRIERKNQTTGQYQDLGPVSEKEEIAFMEGTHKKLALKQAVIGALIWTLIVFGVLYYFFGNN